MATKRRVVTAIIMVVIAGFLYHLYRSNPRVRYDEAVLKGMSKSEVRLRLGDPFIEDEDFWVYQSGRDPEAEVQFSQGRVTRVVLYSWK